MIMSAHQPAYLPWLGYFDKIKRSDIFIFLDTVQFEKNSFTNRNKIKTKDGPIWLSIPVIKKDHLEKKMNEIVIDKRTHWQKKHLNSLQISYAKAQYYKELFPSLREIYNNEYELLVDATWDHLNYWLRILNIQTKIIKSSELNINSKKSDFVLDLCKSVGADYYISGALGRNYIEIEKFRKVGIEVEFQEYNHPTYEQLYGEFIPNMGIVDLVMNTDNYDII